MLSSVDTAYGTGKLYGPIEGTSIMVLLDFVQEQLVLFSHHKPKVLNEKGLAQELCILLNQGAMKRGFPYFFDKEHMQDTASGTSPAVDMGAVPTSPAGTVIEGNYFPGNKAFFMLEAKRLGLKVKRREKEYLVGREVKGVYKECGGIERFKKGIHGRNLKQSALIGFVHHDSFATWVKRLNLWIDGLIADGATGGLWCISDKLTASSIQLECARSISLNRRTSDVITLHHLWIYI